MDWNKSIIVAALVAGISACGGAPVRGSADQAYAYEQTTRAYGRVQAIEVVNSDGRSSGIGAIVGGVVGAVAGHQIGSGRGNDAATVAGAIGGAIVGNEVEKRRNTGPERFRISVRLDNGEFRTFEQNYSGDLRVGDRVLIENNRVVRI